MNQEVPKNAKKKMEHTDIPYGNVQVAVKWRKTLKPIACGDLGRFKNKWKLNDQYGVKWEIDIFSRDLSFISLSLIRSSQFIINTGIC